MLLLPLLLACGSERGVRAAPDGVRFGGWVYLGPSSDEVVFTDGTVAFSVAGADPVEAAQPYPDYPGYWEVADLPPGEPFELRLEGEGAYPTVWAGDTPGADGSWMAGVLFAGETAYVDDLLATVAGALATPPGALADGAVHAWGIPSDGSDWDCATLSVQGVAPVCLAFDDAGRMSVVTEGAFDWFFAFDLSPGEVALTEGDATLETWNAEAGDLVMALWLEHG